jgi:predicted NUDIX family NTP pyrophosphohydrolase
MASTSSGLLLYRRAAAGVEVLLVHPGGPFWARKDAGAWSIPKGEVAADEDLLEAAIREVREELGVAVGGRFVALAPQRQRGGKVVHAWAVEAPFDPATLVSNTFEIEWPPRSGRRQTFPEVDRAAWFGLDEARGKILAGQSGFLDQLRAQLEG